MGAKILDRDGAQRNFWVHTRSDTPSFSDHIRAQVSKANKMLAFIRRTISGSKMFLLTLRSLYVIIVRSQLEYASKI